MSSVTIPVPSELTPTTVLGYSAQLYDQQHYDEYVFDLARVGHVEPFGMLYFAALLRQFKLTREREQGNAVTFRAANYNGNSYASYMGFYRAFGLRYGNEPGEALGNRNCIPLTRLRTEPIRVQAAREGRPVGECVELESSRITELLIQCDSGELFDTLTYSIRELFRNVFEHSGAEHIWYAAQHWPTKNKVEIALLDEGVGVRQSLMRNPKLEIGSSEHALYLSIQPGITGTQSRQQRNIERDWRNSGYGLYMTSALCIRGGQFVICSGDRAMTIDGPRPRFTQCLFNGTALRLVLDTNNIGYLQSSLDDIRQRGQELAASQGYGGRLTASMVSRMLARDLE